MNGSNRFYCRDTSEEFYGDHSRVLLKPKRRRRKSVGLKWQHGKKKKSSAKSNTHDGGNDKENRTESKERRQQKQHQIAHVQANKSLENLNATATHTQQQQVLITADAISDEVSKKTKEVVKTCLEKEVKSLRTDAGICRQLSALKNTVMFVTRAAAELVYAQVITQW